MRIVTIDTLGALCDLFSSRRYTLRAGAIYCWRTGDIDCLEVSTNMVFSFHFPGHNFSSHTHNAHYLRFLPLTRLFHGVKLRCRYSLWWLRFALQFQISLYAAHARVVSCRGYFTRCFNAYILLWMFSCHVYIYIFACFDFICLRPSISKYFRRFPTLLFFPWLRIESPLTRYSLLPAVMCLS